ncbi:MAG: DUF4105 domain-containing protein [Gemmatimonadales bacterium]
MGRGIVLAAAAALVVQLAAAQTSDHRTIGPSDHPGEALTVSLVTMGVGIRVWERFGHNAILVEDRERETRTAYNYGLFDFRQENFLVRFIQGRMWYWMQGLDADAMLRSYVRDNRSVWIQELDLSPDERVALRDFLIWNARPENRYYRYDYYRDNCSTRIRDALDRAMNGRLRARTDPVATGTTYRSETKRLTASDLPLFTGLTVALGEPVDRPISAWEQMFLPLAIREWARRMTLVDSLGGERPLVRSERTLFTSSVPDPPARPPAWMPGYLAVGLLVGGFQVALARQARRAFAWLGGVWALAAGVAGVVLTFLWAFTDHAAAYRNENLFQTSLLLVPLVLVLPAAASGRAWARRPALMLAALVAVSSLAGLLLQALPGFDQQNGEVLALAVPANVGLAWGVRRAVSGKR